MAKYIYDVPPRLQKKKGLLGTFENVDIFSAGAIALFGLISAITFAGWVGLVILAVSILFAWLMFIQPLNTYGDNGRKLLKKRKHFNKSQKLFYFYRGTH